MKKKRSHYWLFGHFKSIQFTMLFGFSALIVLALVSFLILSINYTEDTVLNNSIDYSTQLIEQVNTDIDSYIDYMENISSLVTNNNDIKEYLFNRNLSQGAMDNLYSGILAQFNTIIDAREDVYNIAVISNDGKHIINDGTDRLNEYVSLTDMDWYRNAIVNVDGTALSSSHVQNAIKSDYRWVITLSRSIRNPYTNEPSGIFFIDLNYNAISDLCENNSLGEKGYVFILDEGGNIIYHPQQQLLYSGLKTERIEEVRNSKTRYFVTDEGQQSRLYTISKSEKTGWTVVGVVVRSALMENKAKTQIIYLLVAAVLLMATVAISAFIASDITRPIKILKDSMKEVEKGHFSNANIEVIDDNEIGSLSKSFNVMTKKIQNLMEENIYEQKQKRKSELKALQSQINPHFLYNTLDAIIWMAEGNKNREVVLMTSSLAKLLRQSIGNDNEVLTISQEISYLQNYLTIQKMRYKDKLEFEINIPKDIYDEEIIKLVLQPIVENAIYHGIKFKDAKGLLVISGYSSENDIILKVSDNGVGMSEETLAHILDEHKVNYKSNGIGVYNVQMRLQLYYGKSYGISYESVLGEGTTATVKIPRRNLQGETNEKA
ncbi:cache domain-containing sensor histidine kinase [Anaerobium acetethylicum]|uniref:histidine kinase n=1 Tax=Anaerobium acetethylicum TaxID=1619234 RepID=A0A1D3TT04_9FIRM|nr:sensor histidine kinase [Anaerobium acetethylicum]SCP97039.1 two-component system, sensor histidine kinase YesM [Anaerobium acetethylicum]